MGDLHYAGLKTLSSNTGVTNLKFGGEVGASHLDRVWRFGGQTRSCLVKEASATSAGDGTYDAPYLKLRLDAPNPIPVWAPHINADAKILAGWSPLHLGDRTGPQVPSDISIWYTTDLFPSYGVSIQINDDKYEPVISDASCVDPQSAIAIGRGLSVNSNSGYLSPYALPLLQWMHGQDAKNIKPGARAEDGLCVGHSYSSFTSALAPG